MDGDGQGDSVEQTLDKDLGVLSGWRGGCSAEGKCMWSQVAVTMFTSTFARIVDHMCFHYMLKHIFAYVHTDIPTHKKGNCMAISTLTNLM